MSTAFLRFLAALLMTVGLLCTTSQIASIVLIGTLCLLGDVIIIYNRPEVVLGGE